MINGDAESRGGHLVIIDSPEENAEVASLLQDAGVDPVTDLYWIGLRDLDDASEAFDWRWVDDIRVEYQAWGTEQPSDTSEAMGELPSVIVTLLPSPVINGGSMGLMINSST